MLIIYINMSNNKNKLTDEKKYEDLKELYSNKKKLLKVIISIYKFIKSEENFFDILVFIFLGIL